MTPAVFAPIPHDVLKTHRGIDLFRKMIAGELPAPPIAAMMGFSLAEVAPGLAVFACTPTRAHYNPIGSVHGGLAGTLLDSCMGCAVHSLLEAGQGYTTLEYRVHLVRGITEATGPLRAEGRIVHFGRRTATAEGRLVDADGKLYAHGTTTCLIMDA
jgi:uncharacterized protein (TIGR00369 family)